MRATAVWLLLLVAAAAALYGPRLAYAPPHVEIDEVLIALDGRSIATTGRDLRGELLPLYSQTAEHSWYQPMVIYVTAAALKVLPFTEWAVRVPTVGIALLDVALMFLVVRQMLGSASLGVVAAALLAMTPAHFIHTRYGMDYVYPVPFVLAWLWCLTHYQQGGPEGQPNRRHRRGYLIAATVVLGVGFYSYIASIILMPLYAAMTWLVLYRDGADRRHYRVVAATFLPFLIPFVVWLASHPAAYGATVAKYGLYDAQSLNAVQGLRSVVSYMSVGQRLSQYWNFFNPSFLFFGGGTKIMFSTNLVGVFLLGVAPFVVAGIYATVRNWRAEPLSLVVLLGFITAPLPALIVVEENAIFRALAIVPFGILLAAIGLREVWARAVIKPRLPVSRLLASVVFAVGVAYALWTVVMQGRLTASTLALLALGIGIAVLDRARDATQQWRLVAVGLLALVPLQFRAFRNDYFTDYRVRSAYWLGGNIAGALESMIARDEREPVPGIYFSTLESTMGQADGRNQYMDAYWRFYLTKHRRADLLERTHALDPARIADLPSGSLVLANVGAVPTDTAVAKGVLHRVDAIPELDGTTFFLVLQR